MSNQSLYQRLGGYDAIVAFANDLLPRLQSDATLARFWAHRGIDEVEREKQLLIDYLTDKFGGQMYYTGRDMILSHKGLGINEQDWDIFLQHAGATLNALGVQEAEQQEIVEFALALKQQIVE